MNINDFRSTTIMLYCVNELGDMAQGTGFFYQASVNGNLEQFIVTNRHVVREAAVICLQISLLGIDGKVLANKYYDYNFKDIEDIVYHPKSNVDLCAIPASKIFALAKRKKHRLATMFFSSEDLLVGDVAKEAGSIEEIFMAGYPGGYGDSYNSMPLITKGITATDLKMNFKGQKDFVANISGWNGSSGSPVVLLKKRYRYAKNTIAEDVKLLLAGVMYVCMDYISIQNVLSHKLYTNLPSSLLVVLKAERIWELENYIKKQAEDKIAA